MVDRRVVPPESAAELFTESIIYLPHTYQANAMVQYMPPSMNHRHTTLLHYILAVYHRNITRHIFLMHYIITSPFYHHMTHSFHQ